MKSHVVVAAALIAVGAVGGSELSAQRTRNASAKKQIAPTRFDKEQLAAEVENFRETIAMKVVPDRISKKGPREVGKWLKKFQIVQSEHYHVYTNGPTNTVKRFAKSLEELYEFVQKTWPFQGLATHHKAYVFATREEYYDYCTFVVGWSREQATRSAGHASGGYYATYYQAPKSGTVMHEATHQIVIGCMKIPGVGSWFHEGTAGYIEKKILNAKISSNMKIDLRTGNYTPFPEFAKIPSMIAGDNSHRNYTHAACIVEFLMDVKDPRMRGKFPEFLEVAAKSRGRGEAVTTRLFQEVYGMTLIEVDDAVFAHHKVKRMN